MSISVIANTGVANTKMTLVAYMAHTNSGNRNQVIPGARIVCVVTMKLSPVKIDEKPEMKIPTAIRITFVLAYVLLYGV